MASFETKPVSVFINVMLVNNWTVDTPPVSRETLFTLKFVFLSALGFCDSILKTSNYTITEEPAHSNELMSDCIGMSEEYSSGKIPHLQSDYSSQGLDTQTLDFGSSIYTGERKMQCSLKVVQRYPCEYCCFVAHRQCDLTKHRHSSHAMNVVMTSHDPGVATKVKSIGKRWKKEDMDRAVEFYKNQELLGYKVSIRQMAERFNVPKSTLSYQILSQTRANEKPESRLYKQSEGLSFLQTL